MNENTPRVMRALTPAFSLTLAGCFALILAGAGCSNGGSGPVPGVGAVSYMNRAEARTSLAYVGDAANSAIAVFTRDGTQIGTITEGLHYPYGIFVDGDHNLWVANGGDSNVLEFARGGTSPIARLADPNAYTQDVTICPNGKIYVATLLDGITVYSGKKHHKSGSLKYYGAQFQFVTCDRAGNVFASGVLGTSGNIMEFPGGHQANARSLPISSLGNLGAVRPDNAGNLLVYGDPAGTVAEYTEAGYATGRQVGTNNHQWYDFTLSRNGKVLLGGDQSANVGASMTWPGGRPRITYSGSFSAVWGVAYDPGQAGI